MPLEKLESKFSKYEIARILGARALQVSMDAPLLLKISSDKLEEIEHNPLIIAEEELLADVLPITISRPLPKKKEEKIKVLSKEEIEAIKQKVEAEKAKVEAEAKKAIEAETNKEAPVQAAERKEDESLIEAEQEEQKKVAEDAEIMELANPADEAETEAQLEGAKVPTEEEV